MNYVGELSEPASTGFIWRRLLAMSHRVEDINEHMDPDTIQRDFPTTQPDFVSSCDPIQQPRRHGGSAPWNT
jgi:hypothetical protein